MTLTEYNAAYPKAVEAAYDLLNDAQLELACPNGDLSCDGCPVRTACEYIRAARLILHSVRPPALQTEMKQCKEGPDGKADQPYTTILARMIDEAFNDCVVYRTGRREDPGRGITVTADWAVDVDRIEIAILEGQEARFVWAEMPGKGGTKWA